MTEQEFEAILLELIDENPLAVRAVLQVLSIEFTPDVQTLAVTCTEKPVLKVNLAFVTEHCANETQVKAVILHEFLHILLRHTQSLRPLTPDRHLATDAVINAIIHRQVGPGYSGMMSSYYRDEQGVAKLLRPPNLQEKELIGQGSQRGAQRALESAWTGLYDGRLCADDIEEIAKDLRNDDQRAEPKLLGGHEPDSDGVPPSADAGPLPEALEQALDRSLEAMNGDGIWRSPHRRGVGGSVYQSKVFESNDAVDAWIRATFAVLKRYVDPASNGSLTEERPVEYLLPVLSSGDRRAALQSLWSPLLPNALWKGERSHPIGGTQIYLDVSGSMNAEMPLIVKLLGRLSRYIQRPFWAFSNEVAPAVIQGGHLIADTTGGTSMACVLRHIVKTRPPAAVVVTDGYIERLSDDLAKTVGATRLHAIVTRDGSPKLLQEAHIPFTQLGRLPQ
jgi:hypothetical protein